MPNRRDCLGRAAAALLSAAAVPARAQSPGYPSRPLRLVVPFPAGGATDLFARAVSHALGERLGGTLVIENRPGAGGSIGSDLVAKAAPDGYTLLLATSSTHSIAPALGTRLPYDPLRDFSPIAQLGSAPSVMLVPNSSPARDARDWIARARRQPGQLNYASSGNGTIVQLTAELFKAQAGLFIVHIPYKGTALAIPDLVSGKIDVLFDALPTGMPHVRDGRLRALAITSLQRSPLAPELPPLSEVLPGFESNTWFGLYGPRGLSAELQQRLHQAAAQALAEPELRDKLQRLGIEPAVAGPAAFAARVAADRAKWHKIIVERGIAAD